MHTTTQRLCFLGNSNCLPALQKNPRGLEAVHLQKLENDRIEPSTLYGLGIGQKLCLRIGAHVSGEKSDGCPGVKENHFKKKHESCNRFHDSEMNALISPCFHVCSTKLMT